MKVFFNIKVVSFLLFVMLVLSLTQVISSHFSFLQEAKYLSVPYGTKGFIKAGIFIGVYLLSLFAVAVAFFTRGKVFSIVLISMIAIFYTGDLFVQIIGSSNSGISQSVVNLATSEIARASDMWLFRAEILQALVVVIFFVIFMLFFRLYILTSFRVSSIFSFLLIVLASGSTWFISYEVKSIVMQSFPAPIKTFAIGFDVFIEEDIPARVLDKSIKPSKTTKYKNIIWIVDESVGGKYLSVNGFGPETTPFLDTINMNNDFKNFGVVPSVSNCSGSTNLLLRIGLTHKKSVNFNRRLSDLPTIYQYAKRAGFQTILIDAQAADGALQNHLTTTDSLDIDEYITFNRSFLPNMRDKEALRKMNELLLEDATSPRFIVIVKWGAHWPYSQGYPQDKAVFKPASSSYYTKMNVENKEIIMNSYFNVIRFSVDDFLRGLIDERDLNNNIIFYTSDHGQNLYQSNGVTLTHCHQTGSEQQRIMQAFEVPLLVFSKNAKHLFSNAPMGSVSQEQIFPTTLEMMGYDNNLIQSYGPTLSNKPDVRKVREILSPKQYFEYLR